MISTRRLLLPVVLVLLGVFATPAGATLLVRSDGNGLLIQDKNGLNDIASVLSEPEDGLPGYSISNSNSTDFFKFDIQAGCHSTGTGSKVHCDRNGPKMNISLAGGNDFFALLAPIGESSVAGGAGNDHINGHDGRDQINGGTGEDRLFGSKGNDTLDGAENADRLEGGDGNDTLLGEGNADTLLGEKGDDVLRGGAGNDFISSKEPDGTTAVDDAVDCGNGSDTVEADLKDSIQADCEEIDRSAVGETPHVVIRVKTLRVSSSGRVRARLRCPRSVKTLGCKGTLQLRLDSRRANKSRSRKVRYRIKAGRRKTVTLRLSAGDVRKLRRNRRRGRKTRGVLTSVEKGRKGRKTTIRNPRLRLR